MYLFRMEPKSTEVKKDSFALFKNGLVTRVARGFKAVLPKNSLQKLPVYAGGRNRDDNDHHPAIKD